MCQAFVIFIYFTNIFLDWTLQRDEALSWVSQVTVTARFYFLSFNFETSFSNPKSTSILQMHFNLQALASCVAMVLKGWVYFYNLELFSHV